MRKFALCAVFVLCGCKAFEPVEPSPVNPEGKPPAVLYLEEGSKAVAPFSAPIAEILAGLAVVVSGAIGVKKYKKVKAAKVSVVPPVPPPVV